MLLRGKPAWSVKMLAVLLVLTLVPTLSEGLLLTKCDLKSQLEKALSDLQGENNEEIIAKLVCTLQHISGFNTSLVTITDQFNNRSFLHGNDEEYSSKMEDTALPEDYIIIMAPSTDGYGSGGGSIDQSAENKEVDHGPTDFPPGTTVEPTDTIHYDPFKMLFGFTTSSPDTTEDHAEYHDDQVRKRRDAPSMDGGDGSGEASIDQSEENKGVDYAPTDLPLDTIVEPTDTIYYDPFEMLFGFTTPSPDTSEQHAEYHDDQVRKRRDAPSMDGGDGSGEASIDQSEENKGVDYAPTDLPLDTTVEPTDTIYYDPFEMLFGFTTSSPDTSEEHAEYHDDQVRKRRDAPSMDGGDGSGEASIDQSEENKGVDYAPTDLPLDTTVEPTDTIYYDPFEMLFGFTTPSPDTSEQHAEYHDDQVRKRRDAPSMDGGDGSGEASIDQSEENKGVDYAPTDLPLDTTVEPTDTIYYDPFDMLFGFTTPSPDTSEQHAEYHDDQVRKRRDAPSMDGGDGSGEASIDQSEENNGVDYAPTDLPLDTTVEPTDTIYYDPFEMLFGFTTPSPDTSEQHAEYHDDQVRKRRDAPSMDGGDGSGEASIDQSEENKGVDYAPTDLPPDTTVEPTDTIYYDPFEMLFGFTTPSPDKSFDDQVRKRRDAPSMESEENKGVDYAPTDAKAQTTLYGIFQLSDIACESGSSPSQNLCGLSCSALTDDDIHDDFACLMVLLNSKIEKTFTQECLTVDPSVYFTTCG